MLRFANLDDALVELDKLGASKQTDVGDGWSIYKMLVHCRQSIDASLEGYPVMKPAVIRATVGRLVARRFLAKGRMSHNLTSPVPGADDIPDDGDATAALDGLRESIRSFKAYEGELKPHFIFGGMDKDDYEQLHAMHIADHLSAIDY